MHTLIKHTTVGASQGNESPTWNKLSKCNTWHKRHSYGCLYVCMCASVRAYECMLCVCACVHVCLCGCAFPHFCHSTPLFTYWHCRMDSLHTPPFRQFTEQVVTQSYTPVAFSRHLWSHRLPFQPWAQVQTPLTWLHVAPLWQEHVLAQYVPYRPEAHWWLQLWIVTKEWWSHYTIIKNCRQDREAGKCLGKLASSSNAQVNWLQKKKI